MPSLDSYKTLSRLEINGKKYVYFDLNKLSDKFNINLDVIPACIKVLLENLIRNEDGVSITSKMISSFCDQLKEKNKTLEISFYPTRVLMQDFTGVPAVADLAAMRDALRKKQIDPKKINPLTRVDLVIDHSVMVDKFGTSNSYNENVAKDIKFEESHR